MSEPELTRRSLLRGVAGAGALAAGGWALTGCGSGGGGALPSDPNEVFGDVEMWIYPIDPVSELDWWDPEIKRFSKTYAGVNVTVTVQPWENRDEQLTTAIAGGKAPDVVYIIPDQLPGYADQNVLADVSDVITGDKDDFRPAALEAMTYDGTLYGVPVLMGGQSLMVNRKILDAVGIAEAPATWDDMLAIAPKLKAKGYYLTEYTAAPEETLNLTFYPYLWQAGGEILTSAGTGEAGGRRKAAFNSDAGLAALTFIKKLVDNGYVPRDPLTTVPGPDANNPIAQGMVAVVTGGGVSEDLPGVDLADWEVAAPLKNKVSVDYGVVGGLSVLAGSANVSAAKAWVKYVASPAHLKRFDRDRRYFSPRSSLSTLFRGDPILGEQEKYVDKAIPGLIHPKARQLMDLIKPELQSCLLGRKSPEDALAAAEKSVNDLLATA